MFVNKLLFLIKCSLKKDTMEIFLIFNHKAENANRRIGRKVNILRPIFVIFNLLL